MDIVAIIAAMISGVDIGSETLSLYLAGSLVSNLIAALELDDKLVVGDMDNISGGIRIALADGLNLNELQIDIFLASGNRFDMNFGLSDFTIKAATEQFLTPDYEKIEDLDSYTGTRYEPIYNDGRIVGFKVSTSPEAIYKESGYVDFMETPFLSVALGGALNVDIIAGQVDLQEGVAALLEKLGLVMDSAIQSLVVEENISAEYAFDLELSVDFTPLMQYLKDEETFNQMVATGSMYSNNNTQFMLQLTRSINGAYPSTILGIYYYGGILYIDAEWLGLEKIALEFNMFEAIMEVLLASNLFASLGGEESATTDEAVSASELIDFDTEYVDNGVVKNTTSHSCFRWLFPIRDLFSKSLTVSRNSFSTNWDSVSRK